MDIQELLKWADRQMLAQTGKHLSDLQKAILRGVCKRQTYSDIAKSYHCSEGHVKKVASQLWKTLSESLGESVDKSNLQSTFDRLRVSNISTFWKDSVQINGIDVCANISHPPEVPKQQGDDRFHPPNNTKPQIDRADAPDIDSYCDRSDELATLKNWILEKRTRLIAILGISHFFVGRVERSGTRRRYWVSLRSTQPTFKAFFLHGEGIVKKTRFLAGESTGARCAPSTVKVVNRFSGGGRERGTGNGEQGGNFEEKSAQETPIPVSFPRSRQPKTTFFRSRSSTLTVLAVRTLQITLRRR